ncbi:MAG: hypothetical protein Kow00129_15430 [Thermoleophilia bacterium]
MPDQPHHPHPDLARYERLVNTIPCALYDYVRWPDGRSRFLYISPHCRRIFELEAEEIMENQTILWGMVHSEDLKRLDREDRAANETGTLFTSEVRITLPGGRTKWIQLTSMPGETLYDGRVVWSGVVLDVTERKEMEEENNRLLAELQTASNTIDSLEEIVPICSYCKDIRTDEGYWDKVEAYMQRRSGKRFSHSICPRCAQEHHPEMDLFGESETSADGARR